MDKIVSLEPVKQKEEVFTKIDVEAAKLQRDSCQWVKDRQAVIASGDLDNSASIAKASTLGVKIDMAPHKLRQLEEAKSATMKELVPLNSKLARDLDVWWECLTRVAVAGITKSTAEAISGFIPYSEDLVDQVSHQVGQHTIVILALSRLNPQPSLNGGSPIESARSLLFVARGLEKLERIFFEAGKLKLDAVAKITSLDFEGRIQIPQKS